MGEYSNYHYHGLNPSNGETTSALATQLVNLVSELPKVASICELGCGNGFMCGLLLQRSFRVVGVDASESGIDIARRTYGNREGFICARIDKALPARIAGGRFDAVISSDVIEHLYRPADLLECARELLVPGGWLILGTPYHGYLKNLALSLLDGWDTHHAVGWDGGHIKFFSVKTLSSMVARHHFELQSVRFFGRAPWLWKNMICIAKKPID